MILVETRDTDLIKEIALTSDLWDKLREDGVEKKDMEIIGFPEVDYLLGYKNDELVGVQWFNRKNTASVNYHILVLKEQRRHAKEFAYEGLHWLFTKTNYVKANIEIPGCVMTTINFAKNFGFIQEGIKRQSYLRDGQLYDIYCLGMTREEFIT